MELKQHFADWEWVNLLSFIAESGVFNRANGKTAIYNAKAANLFEVLIYASEKKEYERAQAAVMERASKR